MSEVAVITPSAARDRALAVIKQHTEAVSYVRQEDIDAQGMFLPVVSVVPLAPTDLHNLAGGVVMPKRHHVDRMAEAAGVNVTSVDVEHPSRYVWIAKAHGCKRMPDGSMREGEGEYAFDAEAYAELDFLKDGQKSEARYTTDKAKAIHLLEYAKFGHQRASTGARLALIRYFCKCPTAFKREELPKAMLFSRIDVNSDGMLASAEMREAAVAHALGATTTLFGPQPQPAERNVTPTAEVVEAPATKAGDADPFDTEPAPVTAPEETPEELALREARERLQEWGASDLVKRHPRAGPKVAAMLANPGATLEEVTKLNELCAQLQDWAKAHAKGGAA